MKVKQDSPKPSATTSISKSSDVTSKVKIFHQQGLKQSKSYQTGDVVFGVELYVDDTPTAINQGLRKAEKIVEDALAEKAVQMGEILDSLARKNT